MSGESGGPLGSAAGGGAAPRWRSWISSGPWSRGGSAAAAAGLSGLSGSSASTSKGSLLFKALVLVVSFAVCLFVVQIIFLSSRNGVGGIGGGGGESKMSSVEKELLHQLKMVQEKQSNIERYLGMFFPAVNVKLKQNLDAIEDLIEGTTKKDHKGVVQQLEENLINEEKEKLKNKNYLTRRTKKERIEVKVTNKTQDLLDWLDRYTQFHREQVELIKRDKNANVTVVHCKGYNGYGNIFQRRVFVRSIEAPWSVDDYFLPPPIECDNDEILRGLDSYEFEPDDLNCMDFHELDSYQLLNMSGMWGFDYFGQSVIIFSYLFKLKPNIQRRIDEWKAAHFGDYTIGIQIRTPILKTEPDGSWYKGKADHEGHPVPPVSMFAQTAELLSYQQEERTGIPFDNVVWFLATQNLSLRDDFARWYGPHKIAFYNGKITTTFDPDQEGLLVAFLTWWLLGECDDLVVTEASSYGITAAARAGIRAVACNHGRFCMRKLTPQPCQQTPWDEKGVYPITPGDCKGDKKWRDRWRSVESSCAYFEAIIRRDPRYKKGKSW